MLLFPPVVLIIFQPLMIIGITRWVSGAYCLVPQTVLRSIVVGAMFSLRYLLTVFLEMQSFVAICLYDNPSTSFKNFDIMILSHFNHPFRPLYAVSLVTFYHKERFIELEIKWLIFYAIKSYKSGSNLDYQKQLK